MLKPTCFFLKAAILIMSILVISCSTDWDAANNIYIDNQSDFDEHNNTEFTAGTTILFAAGAVFNGQFSASGMGTVDEPIRVTAYDKDTGEIFRETIDNKPIINGNGLVNSSFYLYNG